MDGVIQQEELGKQLSHQQLRHVLPQRFPFLMLDRVVSVVPRERLVALKNVTGNEDYFQGHFPDRAVMPGVMIIEGMAQALHVLAVLSKKQAADGDEFAFNNYLSKVTVEFLKPVFPGDQILFEAVLVKQIGRGVIGSIKARVGGNLIADAEIILIAKKD